MQEAALDALLVQQARIKVADEMPIEFTLSCYRSDGSLWSRLVILPMIRTALDDMDRAENVAKAERDLQYTCILPPNLNNGPVTGKVHIGLV